MEGSILIKHHQYSLTEFSELSSENVPLFAQSAQIFIREWQNGKSSFTIKTSGSTGTPKSVSISRTQFIASAQNTIEALKLKAGTKALLAMSADRIGGKMMLVRALIGNWNLTIEEPSTNLTEVLKTNSYDFTALVPLQVQALIDPGNKSFLEAIDCILIGGAAINLKLEKELQHFTNRVYHTYGMTETISHIALRKLSQGEPSAWFSVIGDNDVKQTPNGCLSVKGTVTNQKWIETNDIIELAENRFKWLGRADLTINSGGVKLQIEEIENELKAIIPEHLKANLCVWKVKDQLLGEQIICVSDNKDLIAYFLSNETVLKSDFTKYAWPKTWYLIPQLVLTESGKIDRPNSYLQSVKLST